MFNGTFKQKGVALISVLLIVAILLAVVGRLMANHGLTISQNQNVFERSQAMQYALGAEALARQVLFEDFSQGGAEADHLEEIWAQPVLPFELDEGGFLEAQVTDLNGCFNLNNVVGAESPPNLDRLKRMLTNLEIQPQIAEAWKDWIDGDVEVTGFGAEDSEYLLASIPHRTPNNLVYDLSELAQIQNFEKEHYEILKPYVCLLPASDTKINVNTANLHALASLDESLSPASVEGITSTPRAYRNTSEFLDEHPEFRPVTAVLSTTSEYFQLHAFAQVGDSSVTLLSTLFRDPSSGEVTVLSRNFGKLFRSQVEIEIEDAS